RFLPTGQLDTTFGGIGYVIYAPLPYRNSVNAVFVQPGGKIVVGGNGVSKSEHYNFILRLNPDGSLDRTFADKGQLLLDRYVATSRSFIGVNTFRVFTMTPGGDIVIARDICTAERCKKSVA